MLCVLWVGVVCNVCLVHGAWRVSVSVSVSVSASVSAHDGDVVRGGTYPECNTE